MSQSDRAIKKLAKDLARLKSEVVSWRGAQADFTSIEAGTMDINDSDGNLVSRVGFQEDGSGATRFFDGPVPPVPSGFTAIADGPIIQGTWDGTFENGVEATYDLAYLEVAATQVDDDTNVSFATITAKEGASASVVADVPGEWAVAVRSVSQAGKKSAFAPAGTVEVKITDLSGAIEAVQDSANGKNKVTYSSHAPTSDDPGIFDDTWFVGQVGRPNDVIEATNLATNPSFETSASVDMTHANVTLANPSVSSSPSGGKVLRATMKAGTHGTYEFSGQYSAGTGGAAWVAAALMSKPGTANASRWRGVRLADTIIGGSTEYTGITDITDAAGWVRQVATKQLRPAASYARFAVYYQGSSAAGSAPVAGDVYDTDSWIVATGDSEASALAKIEAYFDGDTESGATDDEPHYRWTGTPHASTSEKYLPALDIGDSDNWNIIEQYRHDGAGWVKVELSHYVFSTVDLGKATVGELDGIRIMARTIGAETLTADAIDGKVITGATVQSARSGQRWVGDSAGIRIYNEDGDVRTRLAPDDSVFKGEVEADTLVVNGGAEFKGNNTLAQGANLTLAAGVTDPTAPPTVQPFWDGIEVDTSGLDSSTWFEPRGLAFDGTNYWTVKTNPVRANVVAIRINATTGAADEFTVPTGGSVAAYGVTCIGDELFWLHRVGYRAFVFVTDLDCVKKREWEYPDLGYSKTNPLTYLPGIGNDGTNIVIAHCADNGVMIARVFDKTTGAQIGDNIRDTSDGTKSDITGVHMGSADWGRKLVTIAKSSASELPSFHPTTGVYDGAETKFSMAVPGSVGVVYADGKWRTLDPSGTIHEYADANTGDNASDWWATYQWWTDVNENGNSGGPDYLSRCSPGTRFTWPRRAMVRLLGQPMPDGADYITPSLAKKPTTPSVAEYRRPAWVPFAGQSKAEYRVLPADWASTNSPSDTNNFPEAESSVLESASGTFRVQGDGSGHWGPLTMGRNGVMSGLVVTGQASCAVTTAGTPKKFTIQLPAGRFTKPPVVWLSPLTSSPQNVAVSVVGAGITTTSFDLWFWRRDLSGTGVDWFAMDAE